MTYSDDIEVLAAEYVIGTLDAAERASVAARRQRERDLDAAITAWERRLAPLNERVPEVLPPKTLQSRIETRIASISATQVGGDVAELRRRISFWRRSALAATALAASLALVIGVRETTPPPKSKNLVAVLQKDAQSPAFLVSVDIENKLMTVRPVTAKHEPGKSHELWLVHDKLGPPKSLGIIDKPAAIPKAALAAYATDIIETATFAVSLEPEGGSPTGAPTGPVVFAGKMIEQ